MNDYTKEERQKAFADAADRLLVQASELNEYGILFKTLDDVYNHFFLMNAENYNPLDKLSNITPLDMTRSGVDNVAEYLALTLPNVVKTPIGYIGY